jgi:biotin carboxylase
MLRAPLSKPPAAPPKVLVVGGGPFQLDIIRTARALGAVVGVADKNPRAPGLELADEAMVLDIIDVATMVDAARAWGANGVVTAASDAAIPAVAAIGAALGLIAVPEDAARRCRDKLATFETLHAAGLSVPATVRVGSLDEARAAVDRAFGYPLVVKPRSAAGGRGVAIVRDASELEAAFARAARYDTGDLGTLLQQYATGDAIGVEAFFWRGSLAAAFVMDDQFEAGFVSPIGHTHPSVAPADVQERIRADVARFASALGLREGPANFDLRYAGGVTTLLEVNARLGGNSITDLVRASTGVDLSAATVRAAMGQAPDDELRTSGQRAVAVRLVLGAASDRPARVHELGALAEGVLAIDRTVQDGEVPALRVDEHAILGRCIVSAGAPGEAAALAREVAERVARSIEVA